MLSVKDRMAEIIQEQPEDATYEEIMRELVDSRTGGLFPTKRWLGGLRNNRMKIKSNVRILQWISRFRLL